MPEPQQPSIGRWVHYQDEVPGAGQYDRVVFPALVTAVPEYLSEGPNSGPDGYVKAVHLFVVSTSGIRFEHDVPYNDSPRPGAGHWFWPPRV